MRRQATTQRVLAGGSLLGLLLCGASVHAQDAGTPDASTQPEQAFVPPRLETPPNVTYPVGGDGRRVEQELLLTIGTDGAVLQCEPQGISPSDAPVLFSSAAAEAARTMRFSPAMQGGTAVPVRIRYRMVFAPPIVSLDSSPQTPNTQATPPSNTTPSPPNAGPTTHPPAEDTDTVNVRGQRPPPLQAPSDFFQPVGGLRHVPRPNAGSLLTLAPGILLTNEGGDGHAEQVYLRGFDAREGQDLEFTVNGIPVNEAGNPHGEGYADTHFIIPELVRAVRVIEGPFSPQQGNYAVAGSAEYQLGLSERGVSLQYQFGSFNTHRLLALWGPANASEGTFAGVDLRTTDGFGSNRAARHARAMGQFELRLGERTTLQLLATSYAGQFSSAGVVREDDVLAGRVDFYGTYDPTQGGSASRHGASATIEDNRPSRVLRQQLFVTYRDLRIRTNYTGFLEDPPAPYRSGTTQRGDALDMANSAVTIGARGSALLRANFLGREQTFEVGYYARHDRVDASRRRLRFGSVVPYRVDSDLFQAITNIGLYLDGNLRPTSWLTFRGGVRGDYFNYDVLNRCDLHDTALNAANPIVDVLCYDRDRTGPRDPTARRSAGGLALQPRLTAILGPFYGLNFAFSGGVGARAADPSYLGDGNFAPFSSIYAAEGGVVFNRSFERFGSINARALYYFTYVDRDLIFNQSEGRNTLAPGTRRHGALVAARWTLPWMDLSASATFADAQFERAAMDPGSTYFPPDTGTRVPFVPSLVVRTDAAVYGELPRTRLLGHAFRGRAGLGFTYVSPRSLLYNEWSEPIILLDASLGLRWRWIELGISGQNLLDRRYRLGEYNYVSSFRADPNAAPDLLAARHFAAGPPLSLSAQLTIHLGGSNGS